MTFSLLSSINIVATGVNPLTLDAARPIGVLVLARNQTRRVCMYCIGAAERDKGVVGLVFWWANIYSWVGTT